MAALLGYAVRRNETAAGKEPVTEPEAQATQTGSVGAEFDQAMREIYTRAKTEANYPALQQAVRGDACGHRAGTARPRDLNADKG